MGKKFGLFSFFSGAGFLDLGFETKGFEIKFANENHSPFQKAYSYSRKQLNIAEPEFGFEPESIVDLIAQQEQKLTRLVKSARLTSELIGFIGGPPCPDFSVAGKNKGRTGENGQLTEAYIALICLQKPDFFLFENVKGLWRTAKHRIFFEEMKYKLHNAGYVTTERLINALEYGAPQDRERIILLGFQRHIFTSIGLKIPKAMVTLPENMFSWANALLYNKEDIQHASWPETTPFVEDSILSCPNNIIEELTVEAWFKKNDVNNHPNADMCFTPRAALSRFLTISEGDDSKKSFKRLHRWRYSPTAAYGNNEVHIHPYKARRITAAEALAIQSLPKDFALPHDISLSDSFKTIGNGVPFLAAQGLAKTILDFLKVEDEINSQPVSQSNLQFRSEHLLLIR